MINMNQRNFHDNFIILLMSALFSDDIELFKILAVVVLSVSTEPCIVSESISTCLKAIEKFFQNIKKLWRHYHSFSANLNFY